MRNVTEPQTRPETIGLFGLFGSGNLGNDGSLEAMLNFLRSKRPGARIVCVCANPQAVARQFRIPAVSIGGATGTGLLSRMFGRFIVTRKVIQLFHAFRNVRTFDILIIPGTGILDDYGERFWGIPASLFGWCLGTWLFNTRLAFVSVGAGPITHPVSRWLMKAAARLAHYRSYRDGISKAFMQSIGLDTRADPIYPDLAFQLPAPADSVRTRNGRQLTVGVGLMSYYGWKGDRRDGARIHARYTASMTRFVLWLLDQGYRVRLLMGEESDRETIEDLRKALADQRPRLAAARVTFEPVASLHELMLQIADTDAVVASRFHNIVCSLKMNRPTISLSYAKKNDVLMAEMGLGEFCQHIEEIDVDLLVRQFTRLLSRRADIEPLMRDANARLEARLAHQGSVLIDLLSERQQPRQVNALASAVDG